MANFEARGAGVISVAPSYATSSWATPNLAARVPSPQLEHQAAGCSESPMPPRPPARAPARFPLPESTSYTSSQHPYQRPPLAKAASCGPVGLDRGLSLSVKAGGHIGRSRPRYRDGLRFKFPFPASSHPPAAGPGRLRVTRSTISAIYRAAVVRPMCRR